MTGAVETAVRGSPFEIGRALAEWVAGCLLGLERENMCGVIDKDSGRRAGVDRIDRGNQLIAEHQLGVREPGDVAESKALLDVLAIHHRPTDAIHILRRDPRILDGFHAGPQGRGAGSVRRVQVAVVF